MSYEYEYEYEYTNITTISSICLSRCGSLFLKFQRQAEVLRIMVLLHSVTA